jgi:transposase
VREDRRNRRRACHPTQAEQTFKRPYDAELYKERNVIERFFNKLKQFRRVATRYDKLLANSWVSSNSPRSPSGSNSKIVTTA